MCGVFGYAGNEVNDLSGLLIDGLSKLEYRGYDSAGISVLSNGKLKFFKEVGEIKNLKKTLNGKKISGWLGVGHTRWATHGGISRKNAHPHKDCSGKIVVVHNGIIENYEELKKKLVKKRHVFNSETDTEVFAHLVEEEIKRGEDFKEAIRTSFNKIRGLNAVVVLSDKGEMIAYRKGSSLVVGKDKDGNFYLSSDIPSLVSKAEQMILIGEDEGVLLNKSGVKIILARNGKEREPKFTKISMELSKEDKGGFSHYMIKEIFEEPEVVARVASNGKEMVDEISQMIKDARGTYFTACGTAAYSGIAATYMFSEIAKRHVNFALGSEFPYFEDFLTDKSLLIAASQSGETMDTLEAARAAKRHKSKVLALVNVPGSSLSRLADYSFLLRAGPERAVVSTKAYIAKLSIFLLLSYTLAGKYNEGIAILKNTSKRLAEMLEGDIEKDIKRLAKRLVDKDHVYIIGRGVNYATALEGALKLKEASYIHSEAFAGGELKHGVIALIEEGTPCIVVVANDRAYESTLSNAMELSSRGAYIIGIAPKMEKVFNTFIKIPDVPSASPIVSVVPLQLLGYHLAVLKGINPDRPRNLAKSVTVK